MLSLDKFHFSARNSLISVARVNESIVLHSLHNGGMVPLMELGFDDAVSEKLLPWELQLSTDKETHKLCLFGKDGVCFSGKGISPCLKYIYMKGVYNANYIYEGDNLLKICDCFTNTVHTFKIHKGTVSLDTKDSERRIFKEYIKIAVLPDKNGEYEFTLRISTKESSVYTDSTYEEYSQSRKKEYLAWEEKMKCKNDCEKACAYVLWSNIVSNEGYYDREAILMSKSGMCKLWSWDNTFNALDLADKDFELSYNQLIYPYRFMDAHGRTPDTVTTVNMEKAFVKPPIQGWIYKQLVKRNKRYEDIELIEELYYYMKKNTDWWLNYRGETPCYHHGNDSGNDNATCFDKTEIIQSPDLIAYLSVQCEVLSQMAEKLNLCTDTRIYKMLSEELLQKCVTHFWDGEIFIRNGMTEEIYRTQSLLPLRMIVLEDKLPTEIKEYILNKLKTDFLCPYGLASESKNSPFYTVNGYWRGPAWGPDQIIFTLALRNMGETEISEQIAKGYKKAIEKSGFPENHDPLTGEALKCKAYCWTANAYRLL
ncbi:MAG: hypothetical protein IJ039_00125 [Clostridia bacterium]|nr:hypothetical protein [Clostridia bacterium]